MLPDFDIDSGADVGFTPTHEFSEDLHAGVQTSRNSIPLLESSSTTPVQLDTLLPPFRNADAALLFIGGQLVFSSQDERGWSLKCISIESARAAFSKTPFDSGWIDPAVQRFGACTEGPWAMVYYPPARRLMLMEYKKQTLQLNIPMPGLVLIGLGVNYHLFALAEKFSPSAVLCQAPFPNINHNGWICFGGNQCLPATPANMPAMWGLVWSTRFNADWCNNRCKSEPADVRRLLLKLRRRTRFPNAELLSTRTTIEQLVRSWNSPN